MPLTSNVSKNIELLYAENKKKAPAFRRNRDQILAIAESAAMQAMKKEHMVKKGMMKK